jgi:hypothetical protein
MAIDKAEYKRILDTHGRRVANRTLHASLPLYDRGGIGNFYACYAPEDKLPEHEHSRTGMVYEFDPTGWFKFYRDPSTAQKIEELKQDPLCAVWLDWWLNGDKKIKAIAPGFFSIAHKPEAELLATIEGLESDGFQWWADALLNLTEDDLTSIRRIVSIFAIPPEWPEPNSPEAEALLQETKISKSGI